MEVVLSVRDREITVMLHENHPLSPTLRRRINGRKERLRALCGECDRRSADSTRIERDVSPRAAAFALLGMINWIYQWYRPEGSLREEDLARQYTEIFFDGAFRLKCDQP